VVLYKYLPPERVDVLLNGRVRYTQAHLFNDPFEFQPYYEIASTDEGILKAALKEGEELGIPEDDTNEFFNLIVRDDNREERQRRSKRFMFEHFCRISGVLSLTERHDNLLMWAHYARNHEGFVVAFDVKQWNLTEGPDRGASPQGHLRKVAYSEVRPSSRLLIDLSFEEMFFTKSVDWEYEQEWRVIKTLDIKLEEMMSVTSLVLEDKPVPPELSSPVYLFDFPRSSVQSVFIGTRCRPEIRGAIEAAISSHSDYSRVGLYSAQIDDKAFRLNFRPMNP
jgi:hypothetical protein